VHFSIVVLLQQKSLQRNLFNLNPLNTTTPKTNSIASITLEGKSNTRQILELETSFPLNPKIKMQNATTKDRRRKP